MTRVFNFYFGSTYQLHECIKWSLPSIKINCVIQGREASVGGTKPPHGRLGGGGTIVGTHGLDDGLHDDGLVALLEGVGEHLNGEVTDDRLEDSLVGGHTGLLEGRNGLTNPRDQDELGTSYTEWVTKEEKERWLDNQQRRGWVGGEDQRPKKMEL